MTFLWVGQATTTTTGATGGTTTTTGEYIAPVVSGVSDIVSGSFTISGVNYDDVIGDTQIEPDFKFACATVIATFAGSGVVASMVTVALSAGSVKIEFSITLPVGVSGSTVKDNLETAATWMTPSALLSSLSDAIGAISNLQTTGTIKVTDFTVSFDVQGNGDTEP